MTGVDIIGDIHGHADALERLLDALGYVLRAGVHHHPTHTVVFVGDFVDRGRRQRAVLCIARAMIDRGSARAVMGNHELNAIAWATPDGQGVSVVHILSRTAPSIASFLTRRGRDRMRMPRRSTGSRRFLSGSTLADCGWSTPAGMPPRSRPSRAVSTTRPV
jgi:hypothetical protein